MKVVGHDRQRERLAGLLDRSKLPHSLLFAGPGGVGKRAVAIELVQALLCEARKGGQACLKCGSCRMVVAGTHPDLHLVNGLNKEQASVAAIRELLHSIQLKPFRGSARAIIFDEAEFLSVQALNVLLKTLEEPRSDTFFILIAQNPGRLPQTVLSRCQRWYFDSLSIDELRKISSEISLAADGKFDSEDQEIETGPIDSENTKTDPAALKMADGSMSNLISLRDSSRFEKLRSALLKMVTGDTQLAIKFAKELSTDRESLREQLDYMRIIARESMWESSDRKVRFAWSNLLHNLVFARELIFERNINANYLLAAILTTFAFKEHHDALRYHDITRAVV